MKSPIEGRVWKAGHSAKGSRGNMSHRKVLEICRVWLRSYCIQRVFNSVKKLSSSKRWRKDLKFLQIGAVLKPIVIQESGYDKNRHFVRIPGAQVFGSFVARNVFDVGMRN